MFCPNCGAKNNVEQNYCRGCGLRLGAIVEAVADQFPSKEFADFQRKKELFECLSKGQEPDVPSWQEMT